MIRVELLMELPEDYCQAIGEIASRWSWLENQLNVLIRELLRLDKKQGRIMTVGMGVKPMTGIIRGLCRRWVPDKELRHDLEQLALDVLSFKR